MSIFQDYNKKRESLLKQMQTLKEFEKNDEIVGLVFNISRGILDPNKPRTQDVEWLLKKGMELAQYAGVLTGRHNESWGEYKTAEIAYKSVRDALMIASKSDHKNVTSAKAAATRATQEAEVDALAREQKAKNYEMAADICNRVVMFFQTTIRWREQEITKINFSQRGNNRR